MTKHNGIKIKDSINNVISVGLIDILQEVPTPELFYWSILFLDAIGDLGEGIILGKFIEEIDNSSIGMIIEWEKLFDLAPRFHQIIDVIIIGDKNRKEVENLAKKWKELDLPQNEIMLRPNSHFFINMFDSSWWEVFSKDRQFIQKLSKKFKKTEFMTPESDFFPNSK